MQSPGELTPKVTEDFLFHLYRGGELLLDGRVREAKDELEQALRLKPRDTKGQDLLGLAYFRLGNYPRAIEIYEELLALYPNDKILSQNLSLCYLRSGQAERAQALLEEVAHLQPDPRRPWSHLGLATPRRGDSEKTMRVSPVELPSPAEAPVASGLTVPSLTEMANAALLEFPVDDSLAPHESGLVLVRVETSFVFRRSSLHLLTPASGDLKHVELPRRVRGQAVEEPLGGRADPLVHLAGAARLTLAPRPGARLSAFRMDDELVFLREALLVGFEGSLSYENGRLAAFEADGTAIVQLRGSGAVVLESRGALVSAVVENDHAAVFARDAVVGWAGRLLPGAPDEASVPGGGFVSLSGEGTVFLSAGDRPPPR
jgi:hypothetical protein